MKSQKFEDLTVWQRAHEFVLEVYKFTSTFPQHELYGLISQFRRAAVSVPANIAEGYKRSGTKDKLRFYNIAQASLAECRYYLILSKDLKYGENQKINGLLNETARLLNSYSKGVENNTPS